MLYTSLSHGNTVKPALPSKLPASEVQWEQLIPALGRANRALARYDGILFSVPDPAILLSPLTTQEAVLSSRIEGTQATLNEVLRFEAVDEPDLESRRFDIQEIINYRLPGRTHPSRQAIAQLLRVLREANILKVVREGSGRRAQVLALAELINLAEGKPVI